MDLIKNAKAQAIIDGSRTAAEAEFVARIGDRAHVPVVSFSAVPATRTARFSVATAPDDSSQAAPIAGVLENFHWRAAVLLHEDSRFGAGIVPALSDALRAGGGADDPACHWLYDTLLSADPDLRLAALAFLPLLAALYLRRLPPELPSSLSGFEAVLLAVYSSEAKNR